MPLVVPKKNKKFTHCQMLTDPRVEKQYREKCKRQCDFCKMIQYAAENPGKKPFTLE